MSREFKPDPLRGYLYGQLADHLEALINAGTLEPGTQLPGERALAEEYGVSLGTARRATEILRERGVVITFASKGNFIARQRGA